jgi:hypothetical protein
MNEATTQILAPSIQGYADPLLLFINAKKVMRILEDIIANVEEDALAEAHKHNNRVFEYKGATITLKEVGVKYDYSACNDPKLAQISSSLESWKSQEKERHTFLKSLKSKTSVVDEESGEVISLLPPIKSSKTGIIVSY